MFYGQCWKCGERWELGTASTCKCPEETTIDWKDYSIPVDKMKTLSIGNIKPNYNMTFHRDGKQIGTLDFNGPEMTFTGDADESAKVFFDLIARSFKARLEQERADERAQRKPLPYNKDDMEGLDINQRLGFKLGWKAAEEAHGIKDHT